MELGSELEEHTSRSVALPVTQTYEGHSHYVMQVKFNPKDSNTFASCSLDNSIKVWGINTTSPYYTLSEHKAGVNCLSYSSAGDKPYLVSGSDDKVRLLPRSSSDHPNLGLSDQDLHPDPRRPHRERDGCSLPPQTPHLDLRQRRRVDPHLAQRDLPVAFLSLCDTGAK